MARNSDEHTPHPLDIALGSRVRLRRKELGLSQDQLARAVGITFQQVQKYEHGTNRISFSRLVEISEALECSVGDLIGNLDKSKSSGSFSQAGRLSDGAGRERSARSLCEHRIAEAPPRDPQSCASAASDQAETAKPAHETRAPGTDFLPGAACFRSGAVVACAGPCERAGMKLATFEANGQERIGLVIAVTR